MLEGQPLARPAIQLRFSQAQARQPEEARSERRGYSQLRFLRPDLLRPTGALLDVWRQRQFQRGGRFLGGGSRRVDARPRDYGLLASVPLGSDRVMEGAPLTGEIAIRVR